MHEHQDGNSCHRLQMFHICDEVTTNNCPEYTEDVCSLCPTHHTHGSHVLVLAVVNTLRPRQNGRHFPDDIFKWIFLNENVWIAIKISLKFVPNGLINNIPALVQMMAWRQSGDKPLSEAMMVYLLTHIYASLGLKELSTFSLCLRSKY